MKRWFAAVAVVSLLGPAAMSVADVFQLGSGLKSLETVTVGDPGNLADTRYGSNYPGAWPSGFGSVAYAYNIGKYEVTAAQYCEFLNHKAKSDPHGLYNSRMANIADDWGCNIVRYGTPGQYMYMVNSAWANRPVNYVSFWDACRFANWLSNGQGDGDTETGTYNLNAYNGVDGRDIRRNAGWKWAVASEDEWYKAAYYKGGGTNAGYWNYATQSDNMPSKDLVYPTDPGNNATYRYLGYSSIDAPYWRTEVGAHENSESAYGTFDQGGNVFEWNEAIFYLDDTYATRGQRGGSFYDAGTVMSAGLRYGEDPTYEGSRFGFRVSQVPEPSSIATLAVALACLAPTIRRRRK